MHDLWVGDAIAQLDDLNAMGLIGISGSKGQIATLNCQRKGDCSNYKGQLRQQNIDNDLAHNYQYRRDEIYNGMTGMDLWYWLISHGVSRHEINRNFTAYLFDPDKQINSQTNERKTTLDHGKEQSEPVNQRNFHISVNLQTQNPLNEGMARFP